LNPERERERESERERDREIEDGRVRERERERTMMGQDKITLLFGASISRDGGGRDNCISVDK
jgi:hypothetical protein